MTAHIQGQTRHVHLEGTPLGAACVTAHIQGQTRHVHLEGTPLGVAESKQ